MGKFIEHCVLASLQAGSLYVVGKIGLGSPKPLSPLLRYTKGRENLSQNPDMAHRQLRLLLFESHAHYLIEFCSQRGRVLELAGPARVLTLPDANTVIFKPHQNHMEWFLKGKGCSLEKRGEKSGPEQPSTSCRSQ